MTDITIDPKILHKLIITETQTNSEQIGIKMDNQSLIDMNTYYALMLNILESDEKYFYSIDFDDLINDTNRAWYDEAVDSLDGSQDFENFEKSLEKRKNAIEQKVNANILPKAIEAAQENAPRVETASDTRRVWHFTETSNKLNNSPAASPQDTIELMPDVIIPREDAQGLNKSILDLLEMRIEDLEKKTKIDPSDNRAICMQVIAAEFDSVYKHINSKDYQGPKGIINFDVIEQQARARVEKAQKSKGKDLTHADMVAGNVDLKTFDKFVKGESTGFAKKALGKQNKYAELKDSINTIIYGKQDNSRKHKKR
jgi:hypothetical protein